MAENTIDLAEVLAMLLPPGLVSDDPAAYAKLAELSVVPWEDIHKLWNNSTSRYKKFQDPTSCRLENFWWHVWASDRRDLSGKTLATLWKSITTGSTIVPLIGPSRPPLIPHTRSMHESDRSGTNETQILEAAQDQAAALQEKLAQHNLTPSSSRPPPAHPILKKPRGPSSSGPRPTARFVDVPDSEDDTQQQSSELHQIGSGSGSGSGSGTNQPDTQTKKQPSARVKAPATKADKKPAKKFVASKIAGKRRPVLPRRQSSQSSNGSVASDTSSKDGKTSIPNETSQQEFLGSPNEGYFSESQGSPRLPTHDEEPIPNAKTLGRLPAKDASPTKPTIVRTSPQPDQRNAQRPPAPKRTSSPLVKAYTMEENSSVPRSSPKEPQRSAKSAGKQVEVLPPSRSANPLGIYEASAPVATVQSTQATAEQLNFHSVQNRREEPSKASNEARRSPSIQDEPTAAPRMARTKSNESKRISAEPVPSSFFKSPSVVGMSKLAVKGGFDFETPRPHVAEDNRPPLGMLDPDIPKPSVLDSTLSPTQPSPTPILPMARSKSQLHLLLEIDKERSERNRSSSGNRHGGAGKSGGRK